MIAMPVKVDVFDDFHVHGASAPAWNQRYAQLSCGAMRSSLTEATTSGVHVFHKWMSERVVQQGGLPSDKICFALLHGSPAGIPRAQGRELHEDSLFVLRGGEDFTIQRPKDMALLAVTFQMEDFLRLMDERPLSQQARSRLSRQVLRVPAEALQRLREELLDVLRQPHFGYPGPRAMAGATAMPAISTMLFASLRNLLEDSGNAGSAHEGVASASAGFIVEECHRIVAGSSDSPPDIDALCQRLRTSRRSLQSSFRRVADTTATQYLRGLRLNIVRQRLMSTNASVLSISQAATDQGFVQLSHFTARYKALFGELPSQTSRARHSC